MENKQTNETRLKTRFGLFLKIDTMTEMPVKRHMYMSTHTNKTTRADPEQHRSCGNLIGR